MQTQVGNRGWAGEGKSKGCVGGKRKIAAKDECENCERSPGARFWDSGAKG